MKRELKTGDRSLQITRSFPAPREVVFTYWSDAEKIKQWSGCKDARDCEIEMDFRPGGKFFQKMKIAGKGEFSFTGTYDEIVPPEKIAYRMHFGPVTTRVTVELFEDVLEGGPGTRVVLTHEGFPDQMFCKSVSQGTMEGLDMLESLLAGTGVRR
jgi:uncharacterized protein YndB with AHSA1/START domain